MNLAGKTVKINQPELLQFFYPDFQIKQKLFFDQDNAIIYVGPNKEDLIQYLTYRTKAFINTVGSADFNLNNKKEFLRFVYGKWGKNIDDLPSDTLSYILELPDNDFIDHLKNYWILGYSELDVRQNDSIDLLYLFKQIGRSKTELCSAYVEILKTKSEAEIEYALIKFIDRSLNPTANTQLSAEYKDCLIQFNQIFSKASIARILARYRKLNMSKRMKLLYLLLSFSEEGDSIADQ